MMAGRNITVSVNELGREVSKLLIVQVMNLEQQSDCLKLALVLAAHSHFSESIIVACEIGVNLE